MLASFSSQAYLQQSNTPPTPNKVETITIAGTRNPITKPQIAGSVTIIDDAQIRASGAIAMTDLLRTVAGVNVSQTGPMGSLTEVRLRGTESNHVMVLLDGVAINDVGQGGLADFSHILLSNIARIEILRGPQSAIWGSNAIAGIISITTKRAHTDSLQGNVGLALGDRETYQASVNASQQGKQIGFNVNASNYKTAGQNISRAGNEKDAYSNTSVSGGMNYRFNPYNRLEASARILDYSADADGYNYNTGLVSDADIEAEGNQISLALNWHFAPTTNGQKDGIYSQLLSLQYSKQATDNFTNDIFDRSSQGEKLKVLWTNHFEFEQNKWLNIGLESTTEDFKQRGPTAADGSNQEQSNDTYSFITDGLYGINKSLNISGSYRYDDNDDFDNASSYRVGATYAINNDWRVFLSQGKAIKNPTFTERFGYFPDTFLGNPTLKPEQQTSIEAGFEGSFNDLNLQVSWFDASLDNEILGFEFDVNSGQFTAKNATQESTRQGIEISLQGQFKQLSWQTQYGYLDASEGNSAELRRARHTGSASGTYTINMQHQVYLQADYSGTKLDRFFPPFPEPAQVLLLDAYWLVSANYVYTHNNHLNANLRLSNVFNEKYEDVIGYSGDRSRALLSIQYSW